MMWPLQLFACHFCSNGAVLKLCAKVHQSKKDWWVPWKIKPPTYDLWNREIPCSIDFSLHQYVDHGITLNKSSKQHCNSLTQVHIPAESLKHKHGLLLGGKTKQGEEQEPSKMLTSCPHSHLQRLLFSLFGMVLMIPSLQEVGNSHRSNLDQDRDRDKELKLFFSLPQFWSWLGPL